MLRAGTNPRRRGNPCRTSRRCAAVGCTVLVTGVIVLLFCGGAGAETLKTTPAEQKSISVTIYTENLGLVKDVREVDLPTGVLDLMFEGVAARIDPTSVHIRSLSRPDDLAVLEQNFEYDLISPAKLMEKYVGQTIELVVVRDEEEIWNRARLIGIEKGYVYEMDGKIAVNPPGRVVLPELPQGLFSRPTLVWMLENDARGHTIEASYLTEGIGWKANYVLVLSQDDRKVDVAGWVTIDNRSGATYTDAAVKLVAGDVHRVLPPQPMLRVADELYVRGGGRAPQFEEEAFFEYHLYTLQRKSTIKDNQTKQVSLLEAPDVSVKKSYVFQPTQGYWFNPMPGVDKKTKVGVFLNLENSKKNGMGMPLPKGVIRIYKKDADRSLQFVGEDAIDHTPEDEKIRVRVGNAFDIVGERVQTNYSVISSGEVYESSYKITLRNHKEEAVVVQVVEVIPGDWEITSSSHDFEKEAANRIRFDVAVEKKGQAEITYTVRVRH